MNQLSRLGRFRFQIIRSYYSTLVHGQFSNENARRGMTPTEEQDLGSFTDVVGCRYVVPFEEPFSKPERFKPAGPNAIAYRLQVGDSVSRRNKNNYLLNTLPYIEDSKEAVYGFLDAWVAWERKFPTVALKMILVKLGGHKQWHTVIQVIKWMLSKGQCTTTGTYNTLIKAFDMDGRPEEAHEFWMMKMGTNLRNVPWSCCDAIISVYYQHNMLTRLVKLFRQLEDFHRRPEDKKVIQRVANSYEMLGLLEEKKQVLENYSYLFHDWYQKKPKKRRKELMMKARRRNPVQVSIDRRCRWTCP